MTEQRANIAVPYSEDFTLLRKQLAPHATFDAAQKTWALTKDEAGAIAGSLKDAVRYWEEREENARGHRGARANQQVWKAKKNGEAAKAALTALEDFSEHVPKAPAATPGVDVRIAEPDEPIEAYGTTYPQVVIVSRSGEDVAGFLLCDDHMASHATGSILWPIAKREVSEPCFGEEERIHFDAVIAFLEKR